MFCGVSWKGNKLDEGGSLKSRLWNAVRIDDSQDEFLRISRSSPKDGEEGRMLWQGSAAAYAKKFNMKP